MKKILVIVGEGGSGKTTLVAKLTERYPEQFKKVVTCTSRPKRIGEVDAVDYHFLPIEYFTDNSSLVFVGKTSDGYHYGTKRSDLFLSTHHLLLTLKLAGIRKLVDLGLKNIIVVRISITEKLKIERMRQRGDPEEMIFNRLQSDVTDRIDVDLRQIPTIDLNASETLDEKIGLLLRRVDD